MLCLKDSHVILTQASILYSQVKNLTTWFPVGINNNKKPKQNPQTPHPDTPAAEVQNAEIVLSSLPDLFNKMGLLQMSNTFRL